jgi:hypothetical protein
MAARRQAGAGPRGKDRTGTTAPGAIKGQTLRLNPDAWRQLRLLAVERDCAQHDLLIEAVNLLFRKYRKRPIA